MTFRIIAAMALLLPCFACDRRGREVHEQATRQCIRTYSDAFRMLLKDSGPLLATNAPYPAVFFGNPGWTNWHGPYLRGPAATEDYFDSPILFRPKQDGLEIRSAGFDRKFYTEDDIFEFISVKANSARQP